MLDVFLCLLFVCFSLVSSKTDIPETNNVRNISNEEVKVRKKPIERVVWHMLLVLLGGLRIPDTLQPLTHPRARAKCSAPGPGLQNSTHTADNIAAPGVTASPHTDPSVRTPRDLRVKAPHQPRSRRRRSSWSLCRQGLCCVRVNRGFQTHQATLRERDWPHSDGIVFITQP